VAESVLLMEEIEVKGVRRGKMEIRLVKFWKTTERR
jgi:hypothetical protein